MNRNREAISGGLRAGKITQQYTNSNNSNDIWIILSKVFHQPDSSNDSFKRWGEVLDGYVTLASLLIVHVVSAKRRVGCKRKLSVKDTTTATANMFAEQEQRGSQRLSLEVKRCVNFWNGGCVK